MRVLVTSPYPLWPPLHGGRVRAAGLARGYAAAGADVTILSPWHPRQRRGSLGPSLDHRTHLLPTSVLPAVAERIAPSQAMLSLEPLALPRRILRRLGTFDVYQFEFCAQARWMSLVPDGAKVVYSAHNVERDYFTGSARSHALRHGPLRRLEALERAAVQRADMVLACTERDRRRLAELYGPHRSAVAPSGREPGAPAPRSGSFRDRLRAHLGLRRGERAALFVGGPSPHNREAVSFLARELAPRLERTRLVLAGAASETVRSVSHPRVTTLGYVPDLAPLLTAADIGLNPVAFGSGSSVKVASYLAGGLAVLATPAGGRGFEREGVTIVSREGLADALESGEARPPLAAAALPTWEQVGAKALADIAAVR